MEPDQEQQSPYKWGYIYYNKSDARTFVPKAGNGIGYTLNFARIWSYVIVLIIIGMIVFVSVYNSFFPQRSTH